MNRQEFINWLDTMSNMTRYLLSGDDEWQELVDYEDYVYDELTVNAATVTFRWVEFEWGGRNYRSRECGFDEFIELYTSYDLK
jgi:hypothetical protein